MKVQVEVSLDDVCFHNADGTTPEDKYGIYAAQPAVLMIEKLIEHKKQGHEIIISTDRAFDVNEITYAWLEHYEVPFDRVTWKI